MKKLLATTIALALILSLAACGGGNAPASEPSSVAPSSSMAEPPKVSSAVEASQSAADEQETTASVTIHQGADTVQVTVEGDALTEFMAEAVKAEENNFQITFYPPQKSEPHFTFTFGVDGDDSFYGAYNHKKLGNHPDGDGISFAMVDGRAQWTLTVDLPNFSELSYASIIGVIDEDYDNPVVFGKIDASDFIFAESNITSKDATAGGAEWKNFIGSHTSFGSLTDTKDTFSVASDGTVRCNFEGTVFTGDMSIAVQQSGQRWSVALEHGGASYTGEIILANEGVYSRFDVEIKTSDGSNYVSSNGNKAVLAIND